MFAIELLPSYLFSHIFCRNIVKPKHSLMLVIRILPSLPSLLSCLLQKYCETYPFLYVCYWHIARCIHASHVCYGDIGKSTHSLMFVIGILASLPIPLCLLQGYWQVFPFPWVYPLLMFAVVIMASISLLLDLPPSHVCCRDIGKYIPSLRSTPFSCLLQGYWQVYPFSQIYPLLMFAVGILASISLFLDLSPSYVCYRDIGNAIPSLRSIPLLCVLQGYWQGYPFSHVCYMDIGKHIPFSHVCYKDIAKYIPFSLVYYRDIAKPTVIGILVSLSLLLCLLQGYWQAYPFPLSLSPSHVYCRDIGKPTPSLRSISFSCLLQGYWQAYHFPQVYLFSCLRCGYWQAYPFPQVYLLLMFTVGILASLPLPLGLSPSHVYCRDIGKPTPSIRSIPFSCLLCGYWQAFRV